MRYFEDYPLGRVFEHDEKYLVSEDEMPKCEVIFARTLNTKKRCAAPAGLTY